MTAGVPLPDAPASLADRPAFSADGVVFTVADLARRAGSGGREGRFGPGAPPGTTSGQVEEAFRRGRSLLTADRLEAWLAAWEIDPDDFRAWTADVAAGTSTATRWCALLCSGELDAISAGVAAAAAAACELGEAPGSAATFDPRGWTDRLVAQATTDEVLTEVLAARRLDWTRVRTVAVAVPRREVAEELRHQTVHDGTPLSSHGGAQERNTVLVDISPNTLMTALAGARPGELVGPLDVGGTWVVVQVLDRTEPTLADPGSRALAEAAVRNDVIARALARHVVA